jgi:hypothetical protein
MTLARQYDSAPGIFPDDATSVALYVNGLYTWTRPLAHAWTKVLWIDVLGTAPGQASILDVETGDARPADVPGWCSARLAAVPDSLLRLYCNLEKWPAVRAEVAALPADARARVRYWIANPTGSPHLVPGSAATQWSWGEDWDTSSYGPGW